MDRKYHKLVYTWKYKPKDLFQGKHNLKFDQYDVVIGEGKITAEVYNTTAKGHHSIIQDYVENYFRVASIISGFGYTIDKDYNTEAFDENGKKVPAMFIPTFTASSYAFPFRWTTPPTDKEKQQIIEEEKKLGEFFAKYYHAENPIIRFIYESYNTSLTEDRFLVYLHDIKEAIKAFLSRSGYNVSSDDNLSKELKVEKAILNMIWTLANNEIRQGRHPGKKYIEARDITPQEKEEAMKAAKKMTIAFFEKLMAEPKLVERLDQK